jgi:hypothetical protein
MEIMLSESVRGYLALALLTWFVTFFILIAGAMLKKRILTWDENWREQLESSGQTIRDYAVEISGFFGKIRDTARILGVALILLLVLMGLLVFLSFGISPLFGMHQIANGLWLLSLIALAVVLPAYVSFSVGRNLSEIMLLKANRFIELDDREEVRQKKARLKGLELARQYKDARAAAEASIAKPAAREATVQQPAPAAQPGAASAKK